MQSSSPDFCYNTADGTEIDVSGGCGSYSNALKFVRNCQGAVGRVVRLENSVVNPHMEV